MSDSQSATTYVAINCKAYIGSDLHFNLGEPFPIYRPNSGNGAMPDPPEESGEPEIMDLKEVTRGFTVETPKTNYSYDKSKSIAIVISPINLLQHCTDVERLTRHLQQYHYGNKKPNESQIKAAIGIRCHLHNAADCFRRLFWPSEIYRKNIFEAVKQYGIHGLTETLDDFNQKYDIKRSDRHTCKVVVLPIIVGMLKTSRDRPERLDLDFPDHVTYALSLQMVAIPTGDRQSCHGCAENKLPYPAAWLHAPVAQRPSPASQASPASQGVLNRFAFPYWPSFPKAEVDAADRPAKLCFMVDLSF